MPQLRKLSQDEVRGLENKGKGQRKLVEEEYDRFLADYQEGEYGEAALDPGENRLTVRNRFKAAAARRGVGLEFRRTSGDLLRFKVISHDREGRAGRSSGSGNGNAQAVVQVPTPAAQAPAKKKGGRPRKAT
jgi:hypothetical protein